jgi:hypothetical protein
MEDASVYFGALNQTINQTVGDMAGVVADEARKRVERTEWTGLGVEWLRSLLGKREWRVPCVDIYVRL